MIGGGAGGGAVYWSEQCNAAAPVISTSMTLLGETLVGRNDDYQWTGDPGCTPVGSFGPDLAYVVNIGPHQRLQVDANSGFDLSLQLAAACTLGTGNTCVAGVNNNQGPGVETLVYDNSSNSPVSYFLLVDMSTGAGTPGTYDLTFTFGPARPDTCAGATPLTGGTQSSTLVGLVNDYSAGASNTGCALGTGGPDEVWVATVPPGQRLTTNVSSTQFAPTVNFVGGTCTSTLSCLTGTTGAANTPVVTSWDNPSSTAQDVFVIVDSLSAAGIGAYNISSALSPSPMLVPGDTCLNTATTISTDTTLPNETFAGTVNNYGPASGCAYTVGVDRAYALIVPPGMRATVSAASAGDLTLNLVTGAPGSCFGTPASCAAASDATTSGTETLTWDNTTGAMQSVYLVVDRGASSLIDTFSLNVGFAMSPPFLPGGETCAAPAMLGANTTVTSTTAGGVNDYTFGSNLGCSAGSTAPDKAFQVTIPAASSLSVTVSAGFPWVLNAVDAPAANCTNAVCTKGQASTTSGPLVVRNGSSSPRTLLLVIDGANATAQGSFQLTTSTAPLPPQPFVESSVPAACTPMTGAVPVMGVGVYDDEAVSTSQALPFPFTVAGATVTNFAVSANGFLRLQSAPASITATYLNADIPVAPTGLVAPFWDDLDAVTSGTSQVQAVVTGAAPNRVLTVEWTSVTFFNSNVKGSLMTFQAQLRETSNVIEFHYCNLSPLPSNTFSAATVAGASATVGVSDLGGVNANQHSYNQVGAVSTGAGIRFTPAP